MTCSVPLRIKVEHHQQYPRDNKKSERSGWRGLSLAALDVILNICVAWNDVFIVFPRFFFWFLFFVFFNQGRGGRY